MEEPLLVQVCDGGTFTGANILRRNLYWCMYVMEELLLQQTCGGGTLDQPIHNCSDFLNNNKKKVRPFLNFVSE